jgi:hypothetical protein
MAAAAISDYTASILKTLYSNEAIEDACLAESVALGLLAKDETFDGYDFREIQFYGDLNSTGAVFSGAQAATGIPSDAVFTLTRKETYAVASLEGWLIEASKSNKGAFVPALKRHMDAALHAIGQTVSFNIYRDSTMNRTTISAISTVYVDIPREDHVLFQRGMTCVCADVTTGYLEVATAYTISKVTRSYSATLCRLTFSADPSSTWDVGDYIVRSTDTDATTAAASSGLGITGFMGWMPTTVGTLFGQDCTLDADRLAGGRFDGSAMSMRECVMNAIAEAANGSADTVDTLLLPPLKYQRLANELGTNVRYCQEMAVRSNGSPAKVGFTGIELVSGVGSGSVKVFPDKFCPRLYGFLLTRNTWKLRSLGKVPHILNLDGNEMLRAAAANSYELRWGASYQLGCKNVGANMRITLPT